MLAQQHIFGENIKSPGEEVELWSEQTSLFSPFALTRSQGHRRSLNLFQQSSAEDGLTSGVNTSLTHIKATLKDQQFARGLIPQCTAVILFLFDSAHWGLGFF